VKNVNLKKAFLMKKILLSIIVLTSLIGSTLCQKSESEIALREYFIDAEFFLAQEFYTDALNDYLQVYKRGYTDNPNINYRIGICFLNIPGQKERSIEYLEKATLAASEKYIESSLNEKRAPIDAFLFLGNAYRINNQLDKALESYMKYKELLPDDEAELHKYVDKQIEACHIAHEFIAAPVNLEFKNLGNQINSSNDNYKALISGDGLSMVYMNRLPFYDAVYYVVKRDGVWSEPENITPQLMSDGDQSVTYLAHDGKTLLLTREDEFNSDILISRLEDNRWSVSQPLSNSINTKYWESHACLSRDGKSIYFASNRREGPGEMDIYYAEMNAVGEFEPAKNISEINTELNEDTPFITEDGTLLFFSSQGFTSMGGYDVFVSRKEGSSWGLPVNLGYPINTTDDDLFFYPVDNGESGLMSKIMKQGFGGMDIYSINFNEIPTALVREEPSPIAEKVSQPAQESEDAARITEKDESAVSQEVKEKHPEIQTEEITEKQVAPTTPVQSTVEPKTEIMARTIEIMPVLFGFDRYALTAEGKLELDKIADLIKQEHTFQLILTGFADPLGPEDYNLSLSKNRAQTALNYLISKGVDATRLKAVGKGETEFIAVNNYPDGRDNPEGRRYNRRVEFELLGTDSENLIIRRIDPVPSELKAK
jgi:outer membrane protein OmpA-like peptidoglycan-associated protein/tetratricopeptide (TPR) repeat protein